MRNSIPTLCAFIFLCTFAHAQQGSVTPYGISCKGQPLLADKYDQGKKTWTPNVPTIGQTFYVSTPWMQNDCVALLLFGKSNTKWQGNNLPMVVPTNFTPIFITGPCLNTSIEQVCFGLLWNPGGTVINQRWLVAMPIPNNSTLVGLPFFMQWAVYRVHTFGGLQSELNFSNGARGTIGK